MSKLYNEILKKDLSFEQALAEAIKGRYVTREEWDGFHCIESSLIADNPQDGWYIVTKERRIIKNPSEIYAKDKKDWCVVYLTEEGVDLLKKNITSKQG